MDDMRDAVEKFLRPRFQDKRPFAERIQELTEAGSVDDEFLLTAARRSIWDTVRYYADQCPNRNQAPYDLKLPGILRWILDEAEVFLALDANHLELVNLLRHQSLPVQSGQYGEGAVLQGIAAMFHTGLVCSTPLVRFIGERQDEEAIRQLILSESVDHFEWMATLSEIGWSKGQIMTLAEQKIAQGSNQAQYWFEPGKSWDWTEPGQFARLTGMALASGLTITAEQLSFLYMHVACQHNEEAQEANWNYDGCRPFAEQAIQRDEAEFLNAAVANNLRSIYVDDDSYADWVWTVQLLGKLPIELRIILSRRIALEGPGLWILTKTLHALDQDDTRGQALLAYLFCNIDEENGCRIFKAMCLPTQPAHRDEINPITRAWFYQPLKDHLRQRGWWFTQIQISKKHLARNRDEGYKREAPVRKSGQKTLVWTNMDGGNHWVRAGQDVLVPSQPRQFDQVIYQNDHVEIGLLNLREHMLQQPSPVNTFHQQTIAEFTLVRHGSTGSHDTYHVRIIDDGQMMWVEYQDEHRERGHRRVNPELVEYNYPLMELHRLLYGWATRSRSWQEVCDRYGRFHLTAERWKLLNGSTATVAVKTVQGQNVCTTSIGNGFQVDTTDL
ncbi:MAG: hypothetical protein HQ530_05735 [Parcubacteria group bacterium]|nr:hypothetical protein [Parcubacteria group bacterium]